MERIMDAGHDPARGDRKQTWLVMIILSLLSLSFLTSDWIVGHFSVSEYLLVPLFFLISLLTYKFIRENDVRMIFGIAVFLFSIVTVNYIIFDDFGTKNALIGTIKLLFYISLIIIVRRFILSRKLHKPFLLTLNGVALLSIMVGLYINFALITELVPYEFLWTFTRTDFQSYLFRGSTGILRMRSVFAEPAHFGMFLNTVLGVNLFNNQRIKMHTGVNISLSIGILLTLSFSSIAIFAFLILSYVAVNTNRLKDKLNRYVLFGIVLVTGSIIYLYWDTINAVLIQRVAEIFTGEDMSGINRLFGSWQYISTETFLTGMGIGNAPNIFNIYAYAITELGVVALFFMIILTGKIINKNRYLGLLFLLVNFQRGGYLAPSYSLFLIIILVYIEDQVAVNRQEKKSRLVQ